MEVVCLWLITQDQGFWTPTVTDPGLNGAGQMVCCSPHNFSGSSQSLWNWVAMRLIWDSLAGPGPSICCNGLKSSGPDQGFLNLERDGTQTRALVTCRTGVGLRAQFRWGWEAGSTSCSHSRDGLKQTESYSDFCLAGRSGWTCSDLSKVGLASSRSAIVLAQLSWCQCCS